MSIRLRAAGASDVGSYRAANQDSGFTASWGAAVADGVGGGPSGDLASATLVHRIVATRRSPAGREDLARDIRLANWDLRALVDHDPTLRGMATTLTGLFVDGHDRLLLAHTGDSRAYRLRDGELTRQTRDDSYVQALLDHGLVAPEDAASHPRRNLITASLAGSEDDIVTIAAASAELGDRWLLCSDGITDYIAETTVREALRGSRSPAQAAAAVVAAALAEETRDNATAIVCDVEAGIAEFGASPSFFGAAAERFVEEFTSA